MLSLINKNKYIKFASAVVISLVFVLAFIPVVSIILEILFNVGTIFGSFIRSYSIC